MDKVVVTKSKLDSLAQHINAKAGTTGAKTIAQMQATVDGITGGGAKETWVLMKDADIQYEDIRGTHSISFTDGAGSHYDSMTFIGYDENSVALKYGDTLVCTQTLDTMEVVWEDQYARKLILDTPPTGVLKLWLDSNGEKQDFNNIAVQLSKDAGTIISNGSTSIYPDAPYDAMQQVYVTVDVASGAGFKVTFPATATGWKSNQDSVLYLADGTTKSIVDYSSIGGQTIENVAGIRFLSHAPYDVLKMTLSAGKIAQFQVNADTIASYIVTAAPNTTVTAYYAGRSIFWWPVSDTVISAIEMYNTD